MFCLSKKVSQILVRMDVATCWESSHNLNAKEGCRLESDTVVPTAVLPRVPAVLPRGRGHFWKILRDYRGSGSQDDGDGMGMRDELWRIPAVSVLVF